MRRIPFCSAAILLAATLVGDAHAEGGTTWLVVASSASPPQELRDAIGRAGGTIVRDYPEMGTVVVEAPDPGFPAAAATIPGVSSVVPNVSLRVHLDGDEAGDAQVLVPPAGEPLYPLQWGLHAIRAQGAWDAGHRGAGVRVAVLDTNFDLTHPASRRTSTSSWRNRSSRANR